MSGTTILLVACLLWTSSNASGQEPPIQLTGPAFFAIQVADAESVSDWYQETFGLEQVAAIDQEQRELRIRILARGGLTVEVIESREWERAPERHRGLFKAGLFVEDIRAAHAWLGTQGRAIDPEILSDATLGMLTFVLRDPAGNRIQFFQRNSPPG